MEELTFTDSKMVNSEATTNNNGAILIDSSEMLNGTTNAKDETDGIVEASTMIDEQKIGYCRYGRGKYKMLFICGGVG